MLFALTGGAIPLPLTALHVLAIDLGTDTVPALALGREPASPARWTARRGRASRASSAGRCCHERGCGWGSWRPCWCMGGFFLVMLTAGWSPGDATGCGAAVAPRVSAGDHDDLGRDRRLSDGRRVRGPHQPTPRCVRSGVFSNPHLLRGVAFAVAFAAVIIYVPPVQSIFKTAPLPVRDLAVLACFPVIVWGSDELWRWRQRRRGDAAGHLRREEAASAGSQPGAAVA